MTQAIVASFRFRNCTSSLLTYHDGARITMAMSGSSEFDNDTNKAIDTVAGRNSYFASYDRLFASSLQNKTLPLRISSRSCELWLPSGWAKLNGWELWRVGTQ